VPISSSFYWVNAMMHGAHRSSGAPTGRLLGVIAIALFGSRCAHAAAVYTASVGYPTDESNPVITHQGDMSVDASYAVSVPTMGTGADTHNEFAAAGPAGLRASARTTLTLTTDPGVRYGGSLDSLGLAAASSMIDDLRIRGGGGTVTAPMNLDLSGSFGM
jgi:hypothetical protein